MQRDIRNKKKMDHSINIYCTQWLLKSIPCLEHFLSLSFELKTLVSYVSCDEISERILQNRFESKRIQDHEKEETSET